MLAKNLQIKIMNASSNRGSIIYRNVRQNRLAKVSTFKRRAHLQRGERCGGSVELHFELFRLIVLQYVFGIM